MVFLACLLCLIFLYNLKPIYEVYILKTCSLLLKVLALLFLVGGRSCSPFLRILEVALDSMKLKVWSITQNHVLFLHNYNHVDTFCIKWPNLCSVGTLTDSVESKLLEEKLRKKSW